MVSGVIPQIAEAVSGKKYDAPPYTVVQEFDGVKLETVKGESKTFDR